MKNIMSDLLFPDLDPVVTLSILDYEQEEEEKRLEEQIGEEDYYRQFYFL